MTLRMRVLPRFPATITATNGLTVERPTGTPDLIVKPDFGQLVQIPSVGDGDNVFFIAWDRGLELYRIMSFNDLFSGVAGEFMPISVYDPQGISADAFARANHTGVQAIATITGLQAALDAKLALAGGTMTGVIDMNSHKVTNVTDGSASADAVNKGQIDTLEAVRAFGQCRLALSGGNLVLSRYNGRLITINGTHQQVPAGGVSLAATSLTPGTTYLIYAFMSGGTMTLEASATAHATDATTGVEIKSGDATRTLVGMARPITGPAWADSATQRFVRSWFNRKPTSTRNSFTANRTTTSTSQVEINTEIRNEWLQWADETPMASILGSASNNTASISTLTSIGWDGAPQSNSFNAVTSATGLGYNCSMTDFNSTLAEGYHYATLMGSVSSASTGQWFGGTGTAGIFPSLAVRIG
jgi:hypothetical protein